MRPLIAPVTRPQLRQPRRRRFELLNLFQRSPGGVANRHPGGVIIRQTPSASCCCQSSDPCDCEDLSITCSKCGGFGACTPKYLTVTFSGITLCTGCINTGSTYVKSIGNPNQTYCLEQTTACVWRTLPIESITDWQVEDYGSGDTTCATLSSTGDTEVIYERFTESGNEFASLLFRRSGLAVFASQNNATNPTGCVENTVLSNVATSSGDCGTVMSFSNVIMLGYGGTATVEACC